MLRHPVAHADEPRLRRSAFALAAVFLLAGCASTPIPPSSASPTAPRASAGASPSGSSPAIIGASPTPSPTDTTAAPTPTSPFSPTPTPSATPGPTPTPAPTPIPKGLVPATISPELSAALQATVDAERAAIPVPGISVAIRLASGEVWTGVSGNAALSPDRPVTPETEFGIASITKTFVTAVVMQLAQEGALSLDDPLAKYLPDYPQAADITLRMLLSHTAGIFDYFTSPKYVGEVYADPTRVWTFKQILSLVGKPYCDPGTCYHYSNTDFVLLGKVVELATGDTIANEIRRRLIDPLHLRHTVFQPDELPAVDAAHGFLGDKHGFQDQTGDSPVIANMSAVTVAWSAGAMASTPTDLADWASALYGGQVVSADSLAQMLTFTPGAEYGLGTHEHVYGGRLAVGHYGSIRGFVDEMWYFPADRLSIVVCTNRSQIFVHGAVRDILKTLVGR